MTDIKAILFDFGGTLDHDGQNWSERFYRYAEALGCALNWSDFLPLTHTVMDQLSVDHDPSQWSLDQTAERISTLLHTQLADQAGPLSWHPADLHTAFMAESRRYLSRNIAVLSDLRQHYRLGCISNNWGNVAGWCADYAFDTFFEVMIDSAVIGAEKPDPKIFHAGLSAWTFDPAQCVYVGDHFKCDMQGAHDVGMKTVWVVGDTAKPCPNPAAVDASIVSLTELPAVLNTLQCA